MIVLILIAMVVSVGVILLRSLRLQATLRENEKQIEAEKQRAEEIEEYGKYTQTNEYKEEVAKDKLGMVNDNEIIFRIENNGGGSQ